MVPPPVHSYSNQPNLGYGSYSMAQQYNFQQPPMEQWSDHEEEVQEDSQMHEEIGDDEALRRAMAESLGQPVGGLSVQGRSIQQPEYSEDLNDEIMRQILEQSKNDK